MSVFPKTQKLTFKTTVPPGALSVVYVIPKNMKALMILAHGAGAGMKHPFMEELANALADEEIGTLRFNFPYMEAGRRAPGSPKQAIQAIREAVAQARADYPEVPLFLGGKSYGGRMSSQLMAESPVQGIRGIVFYGFPLHAPGKPSDKRAGHLKEVKVPMLFLQGDRDKLATPELLKPVVEGLDQARLVMYEHADHSFKRPKKVSPDSLTPLLAKATCHWLQEVN